MGFDLQHMFGKCYMPRMSLIKGSLQHSLTNETTCSRCSEDTEGQYGTYGLDLTDTSLYLLRVIVLHVYGRQIGRLGFGKQQLCVGSGNLSQHLL